MPFPPAPRGRNGFEVAIFCALPLEAQSVRSVFDICWEDQDKYYGKASGDQNSYNTGMIGKYNVVLVHMPSIGGNSSAFAAASLRFSFPEIQLALVVGICGVVPVHPETEQEIILGDVVISTAIVQYDFGRQLPGGFKRKKEVEDSLGRANPEIRAFTNMLTVQQNRQRFSKKLQQLVQSEEFQTTVSAAAYPGVGHDHLYEATYLHRHRLDVTCDKCLVDIATCSRCCDELGCEGNKLVIRYRHKLEKEQLAEGVGYTPLVHLGRFGSANTVMKSGLDRDRLSATDGLTAFEMEGAGVWELYPTIVIKAACDYADSHKNKKWQKYAAAMAAGCLKVFLKEWATSEPPSDADLALSAGDERSVSRLSLHSGVSTMKLIDDYIGQAHEELRSDSPQNAPSTLARARELVYRVADLDERSPRRRVTIHLAYARREMHYLWARDRTESSYNKHFQFLLQDVHNAAACTGDSDYENKCVALYKTFIHIARIRMHTGFKKLDENQQERFEQKLDVHRKAFEDHLLGDTELLSKEYQRQINGMYRELEKG